MKNLQSYFQNDMLKQSSIRYLGLEVETLFVDAGSKVPISKQTSQSILQQLVQKSSWQLAEQRNSLITKIKKNSYDLFYELGWNMFELVSNVSGNYQQLIAQTCFMLKELYLIADQFNAAPVQDYWDCHTNNTLIMPDERDQIWLKLDGQILRLLGHIASVHFNLDIRSIDEGMEWTSKINRFCRSQGLPVQLSSYFWQQYLSQSLAGYELSRFGPSPENFGNYIRALENYKVVMNKTNSELQICSPALPFSQTQSPDIDLFLRSVWWWTRLRVRNQQLVLEVRIFPRLDDQSILSQFNSLANLLNL